MTIDWQDIVAFVAVAAAAGYLLCRGWQTIVRKRAGCGACAACPSHETSEKPLVSINRLRPGSARNTKM